MSWASSLSSGKAGGWGSGVEEGWGWCGAVFFSSSTICPFSDVDDVSEWAGIPSMISPAGVPGTDLTLIALVTSQSKSSGLMYETTTVTMRPVNRAAMLPANVGYEAPVDATVSSPKWTLASASQAAMPASRPTMHPDMAPALVWPFHVIVKAAGNTAPPMMRPMTKKSQPRSIPTACQMHANAAMTTANTQIMMWDTMMSSSGVAFGLT